MPRLSCASLKQSPGINLFPRDAINQYGCSDWCVHDHIAATTNNASWGVRKLFADFWEIFGAIEKDHLISPRWQAKRVVRLKVHEGV